jgi:uncharacterized protein
VNSIKGILDGARSVAVVGASRDPHKPAGSVPLRLKRRGFAIVPINPSADELFGERAYPSLEAMPAQVDIVQVFRPSEEAAEIATQAVAKGARALWLQLGIRSSEARRIAEAGGIDFVEDHCMGDESDRYGVQKP